MSGPRGLPKDVTAKRQWLSLYPRHAGASSWQSLMDDLQKISPATLRRRRRCLAQVCGQRSGQIANSDPQRRVILGQEVNKSSVKVKKKTLTFRALNQLVAAGEDWQVVQTHTYASGSWQIIGINNWLVIIIGIIGSAQGCAFSELENKNLTFNLPYSPKRHFWARFWRDKIFDRKPLYNGGCSM